MTAPRRHPIRLIAPLAVLLGLAAPGLAAELTGSIKSVDPEANKIVVTAAETGEEVELSVNGSTEWVNAKGKAVKKFDLAKLKEKKPGKLLVKVEHEQGTASRVTMQASNKKKEGDRPRS